MTGDPEFLAIQLRARFTAGSRGRIGRTNDPIHSPGPRFFLSGCASGNASGIGEDVGDGTAAALAELVRDEPPFFHAGATPKHFDRYVELLSRGAAPPRADFDVSYMLSHDIGFPTDAKIVAGGSAEGERFVARVAREGMTSGLLDLGFRNSVSELWAPWCLVMMDDEVAAVAFAARLSAKGAELGVATVCAWRGRGYAATASAAWASPPALRSRALFYSTDRANVSSQRVVARLGLRYLGTSLTLS